VGLGDGRVRTMIGERETGCGLTRCLNRSPLGGRLEKGEASVKIEKDKNRWVEGGGEKFALFRRSAAGDGKPEPDWREKKPLRGW